MIVHRLIIHKIRKNSGQTGATIQLSQNLMAPVDDAILELVAELNNRYKNKDETYGIFNQKEPTVFQERFDEYIKEMTDARFVRYSKDAARNLKERIHGIAAAKGGFLVFADYTQNRRFLGVFLVRDTEGLLFKRNSHIKMFSIKKAQHIDFEKMAMACRINVAQFQNDDGRYLSFINRKSDSMSQYFTDWISTSEGETNETDTNYLYKILKAVNPPNDEDGNPQSKEHFLHNIYRHISAAPDRVVNIKSLSQTFFGDEEFISRYAEDNDIQINSEFKAHGRALKKFVKVTAKGDNVELSFTHGVFNTVVRFNDNNPNQIIIDSKDLANKVRAALNED